MVTAVVVKVRDQLYVNLNFTSSQITFLLRMLTLSLGKGLDSIEKGSLVYICLSGFLAFGLRVS